MSDELREYWLIGPGSDRLDLRPDPRLSNLRPGWLLDDGWRGRLSALADDDVAWIERQWDIAEGRAPSVDTSWITYETIGDRWTFWMTALVVTVGMFAVAAIVVPAIAMAMSP